jgi:tRNA(fMet)-specific endonuclease VapC
MKGKYNLNKRIGDNSKSRFYISEITVAELLYGASCSNRKEQVLMDVERFVSNFKILPIWECLPLYADMKAELRKNGCLIDDFDLLIGASAIKSKLTLVTENVKHMARIPGIKIENWINREVE